MAIREAISVDGTAIVYRVTGPVGARPLVLVHGWAADLRCWGGAAEDLARRFRVVAVDLRGHGYSGKPEAGYDDPKNWAGDIAAVLAAEGITEGAILLGWSYGGIVLADYVTVHGTSALAGLVFTGAMVNIGRGVPGATTGPAMRAAIPGVFEESAGRATRAFGEFGNANVGAGPGKGVDAQRLFGASLATPPAVRKALFYRTIDNTATLRALDIPVLVLHGEDDPVVLAENGRHIAESAPDVRAEFWPGAQHGLFLEDRARFVAAVEGFADSL
ncbi:alpha/beta hydrolase [Nocardia puris]|uniref:Pimeloyl-ACP methyl ester carboxylesterase n=1 Tax=Nocardia puris TaxID=208602 RepID=A0A366DKV6_9NOCA|nr:alpha/beta hydrolase [Nocardia puris]MBF6211356.1 alpha/beta hydrolase [Nocardia puris]MBF6365074.1 alpha/beta hydrolase [Nocardia puris]MBF6458859.1 alpha/beta hydrolase [Nocardia puris]RBO90713.1 pimeloyl-ACP methyl ester carboxylesterase [Nocardia puris]